MDLFTMNAEYSILKDIDYFSSAIWTERVYGNGDFQLVVPAAPEIVRELGYGTRIGLADSPEVMIVDKQTVKDRVLTVEGKSLTQNLNCRFFRYSADARDKSYSYSNPAPHQGFQPLKTSAGWLMQFMVTAMAINLDDNMPPQGYGMGGGINVPSLNFLNIPGLTIGKFDDTQKSIDTIQIPYGPLFDVLKGIAQTYNVGQRIERFGVGDIRYTDWLPVDRTSDSQNLLVRFSPSEDNFGDITEVLDGSNFKTHAWAFADGIPVGEPAGGTGGAFLPGRYVGFDLKADMIFASDITSSVNVDVGKGLRERAAKDLMDNPIVAAIDGTILPGAQYQYGTHYRLGDIVETQGTSGLIQKSQVTEYIRSQDPSGEKAYPTLVAAGGGTDTLTYLQ